MRIFTAVWGKYIDLFERACFASLTWPKNREALKGAVWSVYSQVEDFDAIRKICERADVGVELTPLTMQAQSGRMMAGALIMEIDKCLSQRQPMLLAPPDMIFGDGTLPALVKLGVGHELVVSVASIRVLPEMLDKIMGPLSNAALVKLSWQNLHRTWVESEVGRDLVNSHSGGVSWRTVAPGLHVATHLLPSPCYVNFTARDRVWFQKRGEFGAWDHIWPAELVNDERQRVIGSSDVAVWVELTDPEKNVPPLARSNPLEPDSFARDMAHNRVNRNTYVVLREGE